MACCGHPKNLSIGCALGGTKSVYAGLPSPIIFAPAGEHPTGLLFDAHGKANSMPRDQVQVSL